MVSTCRPSANSYIEFKRGNERVRFNKLFAFNEVDSRAFFRVWIEKCTLQDDAGKMQSANKPAKTGGLKCKRDD